MPVTLLLFGSVAFFALAAQPVPVEYFTLPDPDPPRGILFLILESFAFVGALLGATLVLGLAFGIFRAWLLRRHPTNAFNGSGQDLPRLDLDQP